MEMNKETCLFVFFKKREKCICSSSWETWVQGACLEPPTFPRAARLPEQSRLRSGGQGGKGEHPKAVSRQAVLAADPARAARGEVLRPGVGPGRSRCPRLQSPSQVGTDGVLGGRELLVGRVVEAERRAPSRLVTAVLDASVQEGAKSAGPRVVETDHRPA